MTITELLKQNPPIYEYVRGSTLYNLNTLTSDIDKGGVFIAPIENIIGLQDYYIPQVSDDTQDVTYYEIGRWIELLSKGNPNTIESLFIPHDKILTPTTHPAIQMVFDERDKFLTKDLALATMGYARSQVHKARGLNKKIVNPIKGPRKEVIDFCYTTYNQGSISIIEWLNKHGLSQKLCGLTAIPNMKDTYGVYYDWGMHIKLLDENKITPKDEYNLIHLAMDLGYKNKPNVSEYVEYVDLKSAPPLGYKGIAKINGCVDAIETEESNTIRLSSIPKNVTPICFITYNKDGYVKHCKDYKEYVEWENKRNPDRYKLNLNKSFDAKNLSHNIRLLHMTRELVGENKMDVARTWDREFLMDIKNHKYDYEYIMGYVGKLQAEISELMVTCTLPQSVDKTFVNNLLVKIRKTKF